MPSGRSTFQLKITLQGTKPPIWRRILVSGGIRLSKLHEILQATMGWTNSHLHCFSVADQRYGPEFDDPPEDEINEEEVLVLEAVQGHKAFVYEYDFGDGWDHRVDVEALSWPHHGLRSAVCLGGANACPPEDCGGTSGYEHLLQVLADPSHEEHRELIEWVGGPFDAAAFDVAATNAALQRIR